MKLLMTTDTVGGVWTYALGLAAALEPLGVAVVLATMGEPPREDQRRDAARLTNVTLVTGAYKLEWMPEPWDDVRAAGRWLLELEQAHRPDVVHLNGYAHGALPWRAPVVVVAHSCVASWWRAVKGDDAPASWDRYQREVAAGIQEADLVVAPTRAMLSAVVEHYGEPRAVRVIHNASDARRFVPKPKEPFVLAAGRLWDEAKNVAALVAVAPRLRWPVCVAGEERAPGGGSGAAPATPTDSVLPLGRLDRAAMADWMGRASIYALPARYEPFGLSALEAAQCGCALVLGDIDSLREVWDDAALYVRPDDHDALADALQRLIRDRRLRADYAGRAAERSRRYDRRMAEHYLVSYRQLVARRDALERADLHPLLPTDYTAGTASE
jgi:glycosyltransferase involved in cell wall biosynthesis